MCCGRCPSHIQPTTQLASSSHFNQFPAFSCSILLFPQFHAFYLLSFLLTMTGIYVYSIKRLAIFHISASTEMLEELQDTSGPTTRMHLSNGGLMQISYGNTMQPPMEIQEDIELSPTVTTIRAISTSTVDQYAIVPDTGRNQPVSGDGRGTTTKLTTFHK